MFLCRGSLRVVRAARVSGTRWPLLLGTRPCALVVSGGVPLWRALWPRFGVPRLVRSGRSWCTSRLSRRRAAFPDPVGLRPRFYWAAAHRTRRLAENRAHCACPWPLLRQRRCTRSASYPFGASRWGCPWRVPPTPVLGCVRCGCWRVWTRSLTRPVSRTTRFSTGDSAGAPGLFRVDADNAPLGSEDAKPGSGACVRVRALLGRVGRAGLPGAFWCASPFSVAGLGALLVCSAPTKLGLPFLLLCAPVVSGFPCFPARGALGLGALLSPRPPPFFFLHFFSLPVCFFSFVSWVFLFSPVVRCGVGFCVLGCQVCQCVLWWCCPCRRSLCGALSPLWRWLVLCRVACCVWVFAVGPGCPLLSPGGSWCRVSVVLSLSGHVACRPVVWCGVSWCSAALCCVLSRCAVLFLCAVVLCCLFASLPVPVVDSCRCASAVCVPGCRAVLSLSLPPCPVLCCAVLVPLRCAVRVVCAVSGAWCCWFLVLLPVFGVRCWLWLPRVVVWWCVSALVPVSGLAVVRCLPCAFLLPCVVSCGAVLPCGAMLWCPVTLFFFFALLVALVFSFPY